MTRWVTPRRHAAVYLLKIAVGCTLLWFGLGALGLHDPVWALISLVVVIEPDVAIASTNFRNRMLNTVLGCAVAGLAVLAFGSGFTTMLVSSLVAAGLTAIVPNYPGNWRLAPATALIMSAAALHGGGTSQEFTQISLRAGEVLAGSGLALLMSHLYVRWHALTHAPQRDA